MKVLHSDTRHPSQSQTGGFTLVELMVVIAIIGILASIGGPKVQVFRAKGMQSEAKASLNNMYLAVLAFYDTNEKMPSVNSTCGATTMCVGNGTPPETVAFKPPNGAKYNYGLRSNSNGFLGGAVSKAFLPSASTKDRWAINGAKALCSQNDSLKAIGPETCPTVRGLGVTIDDDGTVDTALDSTLDSF